MELLRLTGGVRVPLSELEFRVARSGGPGGQSVNTTDSKVELRWNVARSSALTEEQRARLMDRLETRLTNEAVLILQGSEHRSQQRNREAVLARFRSIVGEALRPPRIRRATRPTRASNERRLEAKRHRKQRKQLRQPPSD